LQDKAAKVGFDWPNLAPVFDKLKEEIAEFEDVALPADPRREKEEATSLAASGQLRGAESKAAHKNSAPGGWLNEGESPDANKNPAPSGRLAERESEGADKDSAIKEEFGDILFVMANIARHLKLDPEATLRAANRKFIRRFAHIETRLAEQGKAPAQSTLAEMDALWDEAKAIDKKAAR